jgi:phenylpropionate dioxygenase-like ring-hydroxylating dioxygenase large terminal subunit
MHNKLDSTRIERDLVESYWHPLCFKSDLPNDRDFIRFDVLDFEVVIFNDKGNLIAFDNRCPHRGSRFFVEDNGNRGIVCKYHGWSFSAGRLRVPNAASFVGCDIEQASLNQFQLTTCGDLIFFGVKPSVSLHEQIGSKTYAIVERLSKDVQACTDFNRYDFECNWTIALENALEPYHIPLIHRDTLATLKLGVGENFFEGENSIWYSPVEDERVQRRLSGLNKFFQVTDPYQGYMSIFLFPFAMISSTYGYSYSMQNFFPSPKSDRAFFTSRLYPARTSDARYTEVTALFSKSSAELNRKVFDEDHQICKRIPSDSWSVMAPKYLSTLEQKIVHFRQSCSKWVK